MNDITVLAAGKLTDPILMDWAIDRHRDPRMRDPQRQRAMEEAWFDDLTLRRWLDSDDHETLARLFSLLPPERFSNLGQAIGERWAGWAGNLACHSAPVLARHAPGLAWRCFAEPERKRHPDPYVVLGILRALPLLPPEAGRALLGAIAAEAREARHAGVSRDLIQNGLISVGLKVDRPTAKDVIRDRLRDLTGDRAFDETLNRISLGLFGTSPYQRLASDIRTGVTRQRFQPLAALFREDAPLERLDEWSQGEVTLTDISGLVDAFLDAADRDVIAATVEALHGQGLAQRWARLADFLIGAVAAACERPELDTSAMGLSEAVGLLSADLSPVPHFEPLVARLDAFAPEEVSRLLLETLEREQATYGGVTLARSMGRLGWEIFVPALTSAMSDDSGDLLCEAARDALALIGGPARDHLIRGWDSLDGAQRIYGLSVLVGVGGEPVASFALDRYDELLSDDPESWCRLAGAAPDRRLFDRLEQELPRHQQRLDATFYQLAHLLDLDHPQLDAVGERVRTRRAEQHTRQAAFARGDWFADTLNLALRCPDCGDVNAYAIRRVAINPADSCGELLLAEEVACASCGRWSDLGFTAEAKLVLAAELLKLAADTDAGLAGQSKVLISPRVPFQGRARPVGEVVSHCRAAVAGDPAAVGDWVRLAYCYQQVLRRPRFAGQFSSRALSLDANAVEAVILKADTLTVEGKDAEAFELLDQSLASKDRWRFFLTDVAPPAPIAEQFANFYNHLLSQLGRPGRARLHPSFLGQSKKVGRNDPCPCGSGKKYKKCCLGRS